MVSFQSAPGLLQSVKFLSLTTTFFYINAFHIMSTVSYLNRDKKLTVSIGILLCCLAAGVFLMRGCTSTTHPLGFTSIHCLNCISLLHDLSLFGQLRNGHLVEAPYTGHSGDGSGLRLSWDINLCVQDQAW